MNKITALKNYLLFYLSLIKILEGSKIEFNRHEHIDLSTSCDRRAVKLSVKTMRMELAGQKRRGPSNC